MNRVFWGRPVGLAVANDGKVYISSDEGGKFVLVLTPDQPTGINNRQTNQQVGSIYPNPVKNSFYLTPDINANSKGNSSAL